MPKNKVEEMHQTLCSLVKQSDQLHETALKALHQFYDDFCCGPSGPPMPTQSEPDELRGPTEAAEGSDDNDAE